MGYASAVIVLVAMLGAVTLLPALLGLGRLEDRPAATSVAGARRPRSPRTPRCRGRWADHVGRHPWRYAIGSFVVLVGDRRSGAGDAHRHGRRRHRGDRQDLPQGVRPARRRLRPRLQRPADDRRSTASTVRTVDPAVADDVRRVDRRRPTGSLFVTEPVFNAAADTAVLTAIPATSPQDAGDRGARPHAARRRAARRAGGLRRRRLRHRADRGATSTSASGSSSRLPIFIAAVVGVSFLLLMLVFRSVLVPFKAAIMNLLSIGAAYGVVVAVFQWGWGNGLIGVARDVAGEPVPADDHVRHPVRAVDGLRGVPAQPGA